MKKIFFLIAALAAFAQSQACTNLIVGKKASADGSVMCSYSADSYGMFIGLCHYPAAKHSAGEMRKIYDWDTNRYWGEIPEAAETYNVIGNINEWQVAIGETTYGGREEMVDTTGIIDYGSLIYIALQRSRTAREAIRVMTKLVETYGYNSEGETFTICDPDEAWIMEMQGACPDAGKQGGKDGRQAASKKSKTSGSKVVWVARRIPDDCICAHANQSRIREIPQSGKKYDKKEGWWTVGDDVIYSRNCITYARQQGWFSGDDAQFSWADAYCPADFSGRRYCDARAWSLFNRFSDDFSAYLPWALGKDPDAKPMPLWIKPNRKVSVHDVEMAMRDHYEGTPLSVVKDDDPGKGLYDMPYRPTPLSFTVDGKKYFNERPISTQQSGFTFVAQLRSWLPREVGGVLWFGNDDANMVAFTPVYCSMIQQPECYNTPGADATHFSMDNAYWVCNWVSNMVYPRYSMLFPAVETLRNTLDSTYQARQQQVEEHAQQTLKAKGSEACAAELNRYSVDCAQQMLAKWKDLATYLIVKYNDMAVKPEKDGQFELTPEGLGATVKRPGYNPSAAKAVSQYRDGWYAVPEQ